MTLRWRDVNPRRYSRGLRVLALLLAGLVGAAVLATPRALARWELFRVEQRLGQRMLEVDLPRVAVDLEPLHPAARVRVTTDTIDLDLRARTAALPAATRRRIWEATDPLWREALLVESRGLVRLHAGRLPDGDNWGRARGVLGDRWHGANRALADVGFDEISYETRRAPIYFVDGRVPMATLWAVWSSVVDHISLALRGPHGVTLLPFRSGTCEQYPHGTCWNSPSVEVEVSPTRFLLHSTERCTCTQAAGDHRRRETVVAREGPDRGVSLLRDALAAGPWVLAAAPRAADGRLVYRSDPEPWGCIQIKMDEELTVSDFVATVMAVREQSPGSCQLGTYPEGCLFPYFLSSVARRGDPPPR